MRVIGVVPAAGYATRLGPSLISKEMIPVAGRPVIDYLVERMREASCDEVRVVTRPQKRDLIAHAKSLGTEVIEAITGSTAESVSRGLEGLDRRDVILVGFPDTLWEPLEGFRRLVDALNGSPVALGIFRGLEPARSDVVSWTPQGRVTSIETKPAKPRSNWVWGCLAAKCAALEGIAEFDEIGGFLDALSTRGSVAGIHLSDFFLDVGTSDAMALYGGMTYERIEQEVRVKALRSSFTLHA